MNEFNEWINEFNGWINELNEWINGWINEWINEFQTGPENILSATVGALHCIMLLLLDLRLAVASGGALGGTLIAKAAGLVRLARLRG